MTPRFEAAFVEASQRLTVADWACIIEAGQFHNACDFVGKELPAYPVDTRRRFREALLETGAPLATDSTWYDLSTSDLSDELDSQEAFALRAALQQRVGSTALSDLVGLGFREAVNAFSLVWRSRPALQPELAEVLWQILPPVEDWPLEGDEFAAIRLVLQAACDAAMPADSAVALMAAVREHFSFELCLQTHTLPLFLLVWNLSALWREKGPRRSFEGAFPQQVLDYLCETLRLRIRKGGSRDEELALLALAGLVSYLDEVRSESVSCALQPLKAAAPQLLNDALDWTFVPAFFALKGIALLGPVGQALAPDVRAKIVSKAGEYEHVGPAVAELRDQLVR